MGQGRTRRSRPSRSCVRYALTLPSSHPIPVPALALGIRPVGMSLLPHPRQGQLPVIATLLAAVTLAAVIRLAHAERGLAPLARAPKQRQPLPFGPHRPRRVVDRQGATVRCFSGSAKT